MEGSCLGGGLFSGMGGGGTGILGLDMPVQQQPQNPHHLHHHPPHMVSHGGGGGGGGGYSSAAAAAKSLSSKPVAVSDDEEADEGGNCGKRKMSPWQRMKWTDTMVRLLIMAVYYIGDECAPDAGGGGGGGGADPAAAKKKGAGGGLLQKKGKWKSVSRAMLEKGFYVSPQQCEDKFNDLNKRYKRVNDILGKGTACKVVENQSLMDSMPLSPKLKDEVRKLLNSKHLFFREMCAYHNSCGHTTTTTTTSSASAGGAHPSPDPQPHQHQHPPSHPHLQPPAAATTSSQLKLQHGFGVAPEEEEDEDDDINDSEDDDHEGDDDDDSEGEGGSHDNFGSRGPHTTRKRGKKGGGGTSEVVERLSNEVMGVVGDGGKSWWEKRQWLKERAVRLEEEGVGFQLEALELEKQRLKWVKFSTKKEREMEIAKFENEKRRLENQRMLLLLRQKELEVLDQSHQQQQSSNRRGAAGGDPSSVTG